MRKWMRERLTRRKKTPAEASDQPAPPPLQPAYFEAEQTPGATPESEILTPPPVAPAPEPRPVRRARSSSEEQSPEAQSEEPASEVQPAVSQPVTGSSTGRSRR